MLNRFVKKRKDEFEHEGEIILRDYLALDRTRLANERTFLSYIRTSLYLILGGIAFLRVEGLSNLQWLGPICFIFSIIAFVVGLYRFLVMREKLNKYYDQ